MEKATLKAKKRAELGKNKVKYLRKEGYIPCVIYGNKKDNETVYVNAIDYEKAIRTSFGKNTVLKLDIQNGDKTESQGVITYSVQRHVLTQLITHIDFLRVEKDKAINVTVPFHFEGISPGAKRGGVLIKKMSEVLIKATPENKIQCKKS